jgi:hypothetical protein
MLCIRFLGCSDVVAVLTHINCYSVVVWIVGRLRGSVKTKFSGDSPYLVRPFGSLHIFGCVYVSGGSNVYLNERGSFCMDTLLITFVIAIVLSVGGTIISLLLFTHGSRYVTHPRSTQRVSVAPGSYTTDTIISTEDNETARYARKTLVSLLILLVVLGSFIYSAFHALVAH